MRLSLFFCKPYIHLCLSPVHAPRYGPTYVSFCPIAGRGHVAAWDGPWDKGRADLGHLESHSDRINQEVRGRRARWRLPGCDGGTREKGVGVGESRFALELVGWNGSLVLAGVSLTPSPSSCYHIQPKPRAEVGALPWLGVAMVPLAGWGSRCANKEATACLPGQGHGESQYLLFAKWKRSAESVGGFSSTWCPAQGHGCWASPCFLLVEFRSG